MSRPQGPGLWRESFLEIVARTGRVELSAQLAGVSKRVVYYHQGRDREFAEAVRAAKVAKAQANTASAVARLARVM